MMANCTKYKARNRNKTFENLLKLSNMFFWTQLPRAALINADIFEMSVLMTSLHDVMSTSVDIAVYGRL